MHRAKVIRELDRRLVELGCPARERLRQVREVAEHYADLRRECLEEGLGEAEAGARAETLLGNPSALGEQLAEVLRRSSILRIRSQRTEHWIKQEWIDKNPRSQITLVLPISTIGRRANEQTTWFRHQLDLLPSEHPVRPARCRIRRDHRHSGKPLCQDAVGRSPRGPLDRRILERTVRPGKRGDGSFDVADPATAQ